jgi:DNA-binding beta-propeller fold protein YncE
MTKYCCIFIIYLLVPCGSAPVIAQESDSSPADFDLNGSVEFADFIIFARGYGKASQDAGFDTALDLNQNGEVDFADFIIFARNYGPPGDDDSTSPLPIPKFVYIADLLIGKIAVMDAESNLIRSDLMVTLSQPRGITYSSINERIYVAGVDSFFALTLSSEKEYRIPLSDPPDEPGGLASARGGFRMVLTPDQKFAFVTEEFVSQVEVIDLVKKESVKQIPVGFSPLGIAISKDGNRVYVSTKSRSITILDGVEQVWQDIISIDGIGIGRVALSPDGTNLYTAMEMQTSTPSVPIVAIDPETKSVVQMIESVNPDDLSTQVSDLALSADGTHLYAAVSRVVPATLAGGVFTADLVGSLLIIDTDTFTKTAEIQVGGQAGNFGISPDGKTAYVAGFESLENPEFQIFIVDLETELVVGSIFGFSLPVDVEIRSGKPAIPYFDVPEIAIF